MGADTSRSAKLMKIAHMSLHTVHTFNKLDIPLDSPIKMSVTPIVCLSEVVSRFLFPTSFMASELSQTLDPKPFMPPNGTKMCQAYLGNSSFKRVHNTWYLMTADIFQHSISWHILWKKWVASLNFLAHQHQTQNFG